MKLPDIPTDNLYKFIAVFGLALYIFTIWVPVQKELEIQNMKMDLQIEVKVLKAEKHTTNTRHIQ